MTHIVAIILGFVEGITEFLPISSSGHLLIARQILGENGSLGLAFDAVLQLATSCALLVYFWKDIVRLVQTAWLWAKSSLWDDRPTQALPEFRVTGHNVEQKEKVLLRAIILGTIPAVVFGLLLEKQMETIFRNVHLVALTLILGSILFWYAQKKSKENKLQNKILTVGRGIIVGFFQCLALVPGVSRSGATISGGLFTGLSQEDSVRFSFLLSLPILFGAGLKKLFDVRHELLSTSFGVPLFLGSLVAFVTGLLAIRFLMRYLKTHDLTAFIWYRVILAILIFILI